MCLTYLSDFKQATELVRLITCNSIFVVVVVVGVQFFIIFLYLFTLKIHFYIVLYGEAIFRALDLPATLHL